MLRAAGYESGIAAPYGVLAEWGVEVADDVSTAVAAQRLRAALDERPTLLALDDLQWADPESVAVLCAVVGRAQGDRLLVAVAGRPLPPDVHPDWQRWCARSDRVEVLSLTGLDLPAATALLRERRPGIDDVTARALWEHTAGNPLHLSALATEFEPDQLAETPFLPAPAAYARAVAATLSRLPAEAVAAAQGLAVLGDRWSPLPALAELLQLPDLSGPVQPLVDAELAQLRATAAAPTVRIAHALTRAAIYQETPLPVRRTLHARAATLVSGRGAVLDHRRAAAERYDDDLATELEDYARTLYEQRSYRLASHYQAVAAEVTRDQAERERRYLESMFERLLAGDRHAVRAARPVILETSDPLRQTVVLGALAIWERRYHDSIAMLEPVAADGATSDPVTAYRANVLLGWAQLMVGAAVELIRVPLDRAAALGIVRQLGAAPRRPVRRTAGRPFAVGRRTGGGGERPAGGPGRGAGRSHHIAVLARDGASQHRPLQRGHGRSQRAHRAHAERAGRVQLGHLSRRAGAGALVRRRLGPRPAQRSAGARPQRRVPAPHRGGDRSDDRHRRRRPRRRRPRPAARTHADRLGALGCGGRPAVRAGRAPRPRQRRPESRPPRRDPQTRCRRSVRGNCASISSGACTPRSPPSGPASSPMPVPAST